MNANEGEIDLLSYIFDRERIRKLSCEPKRSVHKDTRGISSNDNLLNHSSTAEQVILFKRRMLVTLRLWTFKQFKQRNVDA
jgi:hypothetical protein